MQEWMIAMFIVSILLILRDMAKTVFSDMRKSAATVIYEEHPQKERMRRYAAAFQKLADSFYGLPYRKDYISNGELEDMIRQLRDGPCRSCTAGKLCWGEHPLQTYQILYHLLRLMEKQDVQKIMSARANLTEFCINQGKMTEQMQRLMERQKQILIWNNKLLENRMAVAEQLGEMAQLMNTLSNELFDIIPVDAVFQEELKRRLKKKHILAGNIWMLEQPDEKIQYFCELYTKGKRCISAAEAGQVLSKMCGCQMTPRIEGKMFLTKEKMTVRFVEDVNFRILYGAAKVTKDRETISGDNYMCTAEDNGQFFMCLSDGMGSGLEACKESEHVVDLLEQLVESGFSGESAAKLVNSVLNLQMRGGKFSTVDVSIIDLYTGMCHFLKAGAATTFIKRDQWVESISSESMALGLVFPADYESLTKKLYNGDFLIMGTDGVLDALPEERAEETLKEIILQTHAKAPQELGRGILQKVLALCEYKAADDMTVLAAGVWKK